MSTEKWVAKLVVHRNFNRIALYFDHDEAIEQRIKKIKGARWSVSLKAWHIPDTAENRLKFKLILANKPVENLKIAEINQLPLINLKRELEIKGYSKSTIITYCNEFSQFLAIIKNTSANDFSTDRIKDYLQYCLSELKLTEATVHSRINALKFYYEKVLGNDIIFFNIPRPKKKLQNPNFFNQDEIASILNQTSNLKHKTMLMLAYSAGLRVSEVVNLKVAQIDSKRMQISIVQAKGKKDRMVALSAVMLIILRKYFLEYKPLKTEFLFTGLNLEQPYSSRSLQMILHTAKQKAGILKPGSIHALRHSFATHLMDKGTDINMIMKLLGHNDIKTTLRYIHVSNRDLINIISPLDDLNLNI